MSDLSDEERADYESPEYGTADQLKDLRESLEIMQLATLRATAEILRGFLSVTERQIHRGEARAKQSTIEKVHVRVPDSQE